MINKTLTLNQEKDNHIDLHIHLQDQPKVIILPPLYLTSLDAINSTLHQVTLKLLQVATSHIFVHGRPPISFIASLNLDRQTPP